MSTSGGGFLRAARAWRHLAACRRPGRGPRTVRAKTVGWRSRLDKRRAPDVRPPQLNAGSAPRPHAMRAPPAAPGRGAGGAPPDTPGDYSPRPESRAPRYLKVGTDPQALRGPFAMRLRRLPLAALIASVCAASFTGCHCGSTRVVGPPLPPLSPVVLTPATAPPHVGDTRQFVATALDTDSVVVAGAAFDWTSGDPNVLTVSSTGLVSAVGEGVTRLIAAAGGKADPAIVAVIVHNGWYVQPSSTTYDLNGVYFLPDGRNGWAVGNAGTIVHTSTAGASWGVQASSSAFSLNGVWFTTPATGFVVGQGGTVLITRNGGASWSRLTGVPAGEHLFGVRFADSSHGWAVGANGTILRTADTGGSWTRVNPTAQQLNGVSFSDTTDGWAVGEGGVIVGTHDGGRSWYVVHPAVPALSLPAW